VLTAQKQPIAEEYASFCDLTQKLVGAGRSTAARGELLASFLNFSGHALARCLRQSPSQNGSQFPLLVRGEQVSRFQDFPEWHGLGHEKWPLNLCASTVSPLV
jgi:hypothetical protein